jgi:hypothetical protein
MPANDAPLNAQSSAVCSSAIPRIVPARYGDQKKPAERRDA